MSSSSSSTTTTNTTAATNVLPLLLLIYGLLLIAVLYGIIVFVQRRHKRRHQLLNQNSNNNNKIRDTVNHLKKEEITSIYDSMIYQYDQQMLELNSQNAIFSSSSSSSSCNDDDMTYIANRIQPNSTIWDIITICCSTPTSIVWSTIDYNRVTLTRHQRMEQDQQQQQQQQLLLHNDNNNNGTTTNTTTVDAFDELFNDTTGWDNDDDDDDDNDTKQKKTKKEKERSFSSSDNHTTNHKKVVLLEGIDDGVLGQQWVENVLVLQQESSSTSTSQQSTSTNVVTAVWPPHDLGIFTNRTYEYIDPIQQLLQTTITTTTKTTTTTTTDVAVNTNTNNNNTKLVSVMDHPALRRTLCMIVARFNSIVLNNHTELIQAGTKQLIDLSYFKSSMEFRNRITMLLEATLQIAILMQCSPLVCTILTAITTFKIGITYNEIKAIPYFNTIMTRQYNILPRLQINAQSIRKSTKTQPISSPSDQNNNNNNKNNKNDTNENDDDDDMTNDDTTIRTMYIGDTAELVLDVERIHATQFLRVKMEQYQQQGIPPQIGLQSYREKWWFLLRMKQQQQQQQQKSSSSSSIPSDTTTTTTDSSNRRPLFPPLTIPLEAKFTVKSEQLLNYESIYNQNSEHRLLTAWPLTITNIAQQRGQVKIQFITPSIPGRYTYYLHIHSTDFLGANHDTEFQINVIDHPSSSSVPTTTIVAQEVTENEPKKEK